MAQFSIESEKAGQIRMKEMAHLERELKRGLSQREQPPTTAWDLPVEDEINLQKAVLGVEI